MALLAKCFDGKPCPGCNETVGMEYAYIFNALNRLDQRENKIMEHLVELHGYPAELPAPVIPHPAIDNYIELYRRLREIIQLIVLDGTIIRWSPGTWACLERLGPFWKATMHEVDELLEEHQADNRHCRGEMNVLKEARGSKHNHWGLRGPDTSYDHFVAIMGEDEHHNLVHRTCGTRLGLAEFHLDNLRRDPTFYGKVWCPSTRCRIGDIPFAEFDLVSLDPIPTDTADG